MAITRFQLAILVAIAATIGCSKDFYEPPPVLFGAATYSCSGPSDAMCDGAKPAPTSDSTGISLLPPIAVGGTFSLVGGATTLSPVRLSDAGGGAVRAEQDGVAAVTDFSFIEHVELFDVAMVQVSHESSAGTNQFDEIYGETDFALRRPVDRLRATLVTIDGDVLAGEVPVSWSGDNEKVATLTSQGNLVEVDLGANGVVNITLEMGDTTVVLPFTVAP